MQKPGSIRAGLDAVATTNAIVGVYQYDAVRRLECRPDRTHLNAGRVLAVIAELGHEETSNDVGFRTIALKAVYRTVGAVYDDFFVHPLAINYSVPLYPRTKEERNAGNIVFGLTGVGAATATNTLIYVDPHSPVVVIRIMTARENPDRSIFKLPCKRGAGNKSGKNRQQQILEELSPRLRRI
jgi:hypothetical protein